RDLTVTGVQTCALPISNTAARTPAPAAAAAPPPAPVPRRRDRACRWPPRPAAHTAPPAAAIRPEPRRPARPRHALEAAPPSRDRSEERRVGKECRAGGW